MPPRPYRLGEFARLEVARNTPHGLILTDGDRDILLPRKESPLTAAPGDELDVFLYADSDDRPIATVKKPLAAAGQFALMECVSSTAIGAFMNWGLDKDLLVPYAEQKTVMKPGQKYIVRVVRDELSSRLHGSTRLRKFLFPADSSISQGAAVELLPYFRSPEALLVIVNNRFAGGVFPDEETEPMHLGKKASGYIKSIRDDGKVSVSLRPQGYQSAVVAQEPMMLEMLERAGGFLPYNDSSTPDEIQRMFKMSKGSFKKLIGRLFRDGRIVIDDDGIHLHGERR